MREVYKDGQLVAKWDTTTRTFTDENGSRPFTDEENAWADAREADMQIESEQRDLRQLALAALESNRVFLDIQQPTNAEAVAQIQALTRQINALIRLAK